MVRLAWPGWWLGLLVGVGSPVAAQANVLPPRVELKENYPNPFFPATTIPFAISQEVCARGHQPVVSLKIYNVLVQVVAIPVLAKLGRASGWTVFGFGAASIGRSGTGSIWTDRREATPGVYYYQLTVDGERFTRKMIAQKKVTSRTVRGAARKAAPLLCLSIAAVFVHFAANPAELRGIGLASGAIPGSRPTLAAGRQLDLRGCR